MQQAKQINGLLGGWLLLIALVGLFAVSGCTHLKTFFEASPFPSKESEAHYPEAKKKALALYREAWLLVKQDYLDATQNNQDWKRWATRYDKAINTDEDAYVAISTMLASLNDPYTVFLEPKFAKEQDIHIASRLFGVGMQLGERDGKKLVISPIEDSPADKAKILPLDEIIKVNGQDIRALPLDVVVSKIRGPKGTRVNITFLRSGKPREVALVRDEIKLKTLVYKQLPNQVAYIQYSTFISQDGAEEMANALKKAATSSKALILDIRGNNGGLLQNALMIADMFLKKGNIVIVESGKGERQYFDADKASLYNKPVVLLVDGGSASASEILAGALKDNKAATIMGMTTFGKGLVQKINNLQDGSELNLTVSKYLTPNGRNIHHVGITPEVEVKMTEKEFLSGKDPILDKAKAYLAEKLK